MPKLSQFQMAIWCHRNADVGRCTEECFHVRQFHYIQNLKLDVKM